MNAKSISKFLLAAIFICTFVACDKSEETLVENDTTVADDDITFSDDTTNEDNSDDDNNNNDSTASKKFMSKLDDIAWNTDDASGIYLNGLTGFMTVNAVTTTGEKVSINIASPTDSNFILNDEAYNYTTYTSADGEVFTTKIGDNSGGLITLTDYSAGTVSGEFEVEVYSPTLDSVIKLTEGSFTDITLTEVENSFGAMVNGTDLDIVNYTGALDSNRLIIGGAEAAGMPALLLMFPSDVEAGTYEFDASTYAALYFVTEDDFKVAIGSELVITEHDIDAKHVVGTFGFVSYDLTTFEATTISNGTFDIYYF